LRRQRFLVWHTAKPARSQQTTLVFPRRRGTTPHRDRHETTQRLAGAAARRLGGTSTGMPSATRAACMAPSPSVGWAWMEPAISSRVASKFSGSTPSGIRLNDDMPLFGDEIARMEYERPIQDAAAIAAQPRVRALNGSNRSYFCGAYLRHGFHE